MTNHVLGIKNVINADADFIIDNQLFEMKVGKMTNYRYVLLQLLGYTSLLSLREIYIKNIYVINLYKNVIGCCNISEWTKEDRTRFLKYMEIVISKISQKFYI